VSRPIVTLTVNPAIDIATTVGRVIPLHKMRCSAERRDAGGGGINVARVLKRLDADVLAVYTAGGPTGAMLRHLVEAEGIEDRIVAIAGDTREDFSVTEEASGQQYRFVLPGPAMVPTEYDGVLDAIRALERAPQMIVASGSLPPGAPPGFYREVAKAARDIGAEIVVDASGAALAAALEEGVTLIKPSLREFREFTGLALSSEDSWGSAAAKLITKGQARAVALTLGEDGAILVTRDGAWRGFAPKVEVISAVGAGDSFLGALLSRLALGHGYEEALRYGIAGGTAALRSPGTGLCNAEGLHAMLSRIRIERMR
jgi:6-phosphofructokinase 2